MRPTQTCHTTRAILRALGSDHVVDHNGLYVVEPEFPDVNVGSDDFRRSYLAYNVARKRELDSPETRDAAYASFMESEARCMAIEKSGLPLNLDWLSRWSLVGARSLAHSLLGDSIPPQWYQECTFTGGASTSRRRSESHPALKWWASPSLHVTPLALKHLIKLKESSEVLDVVWAMPGVLSTTTYDVERDWFTIVPGSTLQFVEKNYKTKRAILIEPDGNMLLQKGVGNIIRKRLRSVGINLNDQSRNQRLAFAGSLTGSLGTIDLSAASDSVTLQLLRFLLPEAWYELLYELRSPCYKDGETWRTMRKVSSMGNGFTFELESLVFYCLSQAVVNLLRPSETRVSIYGDDIIVASSVCGALESVLNQCGFLLNKSKSYWSGPFRESCGKHYHNGADVTPLYIKADLDLQQLFRLYNQFRCWAGGLHFDPRYSDILQYILSQIPVKERNQVPLDFSSTCGLWFLDTSVIPVRSYLNRHGLHMMEFFEVSNELFDLTEKCDDELAWLYRHAERWTPSCKWGTTEYTPFSLVREGKPRRRRVVIPVARGWS
jgi:hypothetical protein